VGRGGLRPCHWMATCILFHALLFLTVLEVPQPLQLNENERRLPGAAPYRRRRCNGCAGGGRHVIPAPVTSPGHLKRAEADLTRPGMSRARNITRQTFRQGRAARLGQRMALSLHGMKGCGPRRRPFGARNFSTGGDMKHVPVMNLVEQGYFWPGTSLLRNLVRNLGEDGPLQESIQDLLSLLTLHLLASRN